MFDRVPAHTFPPRIKADTGEHSINPLQALTKLKHVEGNTFRRIRDDKSLAEEITFELGPDGEVLRMKQHSNYSNRIR